MVGIENLKLAVKFALGLTKGVVEKLDDKKLTLWEIISLGPQLLALPGLIQNASDLYDELQDLTDEETDELFEYAKEEFDLTDENVENVIEKAFDLVNALADLAFAVKAL